MFKLNMDTDRDGVLDYRDCQPFNPKKQDVKLNKKMQEEVKQLPIYVSDIPGEEYHVLSKEARSKAPIATTQLLSAIKKFPYILTDIKKSKRKFVYSSVLPRDRIALDVRKSLMQTPEVKHAIFGSETTNLQALEPFARRYERKISETGWDAYAFPTEYKRPSNKMPNIKHVGSSPFALKDYDWTHRKHIDRVRKTNNIPYKMILNQDFEDSIANSVSSSSLFSQIIRDVQVRGKLMKSHIRQIRMEVKWRTQSNITRKLVSYSYPKSWATAFYVSNYEKINNMMERITEKLIRDNVPSRCWKNQYGEYDIYGY